jgi:hypothetical protein
MTRQKKPGTISLGWHYFTASQFADRHKEYLTNHKEGETFLNFLTES